MASSKQDCLTGSAFKAILGTLDSNGAQVILYDSSSGRSNTLVTLPGQQYSPETAFVSSDQVSYLAVTGSGSSIMTFNLGDRQQQSVTTVPSPSLIGAYAWSTDAKTMAFVVHDPTAGTEQLWLKHGSAGPSPLTEPLIIPGRGLGADDEDTVQFSATGEFLALVDTNPVGGRLQIFEAPSGRPVWTASSSAAPATMATWSGQGNVLYYRDSSGIRYIDAVSPTEVGTLVAGLNWFDPYASPDGCFIAYTVRASFVPHVELRNLRTGAVEPVQPESSRSAPIFVTADRLWYREEQPDPHQVHPSMLTGRIFEYSLVSKQEKAVDVGNVFSIGVWPR